jgi:UDPglucose--hexose-1-phosphate uridylyltransferase
LSFAQPADIRAGTGATEIAPAGGAHEVIIESPRHLLRTAELSTGELRDVLDAYALRLAHWRSDGRLRYALVFKNQGPQAGASLAHLHSQLIALPAVPAAVGRELARAEQAYRQDRTCPYCRWIAHERAAADRVVWERDGFIAFCPPASLQPFETWLLPTEHAPWFEHPMSPKTFDELSVALHALITRLESVLPAATYNVLVRTAPWMDGIEPWSHWRIEILPRLAALAGMELGTGIHINPLSPEHAAERLRTVAST